MKFLYVDGDLCEEFSGGWTLSGTYNDGSLQETYIDVTGTNNYGDNLARTTSVVDVTNYKTLMVRLTCRNPSNKLTGSFGLSTTTTINNSSAAAARQSFSAISSETTQDYSCDISSVSGSHYVFVVANFNNSEGNLNYVRINRVTLIP